MPTILDNLVIRSLATELETNAKTQKREYHADTLLMITALIHTMFESELRFASFENKR